MSAITASAARGRLSGVALVAARLAWIALAVGGVAAFVASLPAAYRGLAALQEPWVRRPEVGAGLAAWGVSAQTYAAAMIVALVLIAAVFVGVGVLIVVRRRDDPSALLFSAILVAFGVVWPNTLRAEGGVLAASTLVYGWFALYGFFGLLYYFPDARFVPGWSGRVFAAFVALLIAAELGAWPDLLEAATLFSFLGFGIWSQIHRFRRVSDLVARQQTKWAVTALVICVLGFAATASLSGLQVWRTPTGALVADVVELSVYGGLFCLVPLAIGRAVLRHRLWDIDPIINRALVLGALTASLALVYALVVTVVGRRLQVGDAPWVSFLAAAVVAVLFAPLRARLQRRANRLTYGDRDDPQHAVTTLARRLDDTLAPEEMLPAVVGSVRSALRAPYAAVIAPDGTVLAASGVEPPRTTSLPLTSHGQQLGSLHVAARGPGERYDRRDERLLDELTRQTSAAVEAVVLHERTARLAAELQASRERIVTGREEERRRLRRELHDSLGPALATQAMLVETARNLVATQPDRAEELLDRVLASTTDAVAHVRHVASGLRPPALDDVGLLAALQRLADPLGAGGLVVTVTAEDVPPLPAAVEVAVYQIAAEALTNTLRHANASRAEVTLVVGPDVVLTVRDDGVGLPQSRAAGVGTASMRERAAELGGECAIGPAADGGTLVRARLPWGTAA
jgi:signal transduction histidine kinase